MKTYSMIERLVDDWAPLLNKRLLVLINGAGGTSQMELHILYRRKHQNLTGRGFEIEDAVVDSFFTTLEMVGFSLPFCAVDID